MAGKDMTEKALEAYSDVFADMMNQFLFDGKDIVREEDLIQMRERSVYYGDKSLREQERDTVKPWQHGQIQIAYVGFENESASQQDMPLRVLGYDGASYRDQIHYVTDKDGSRRKVVTPTPVVTIVLYFGYKKRWDGPLTLYELLGDRLRDDLKPYVNDYHINLIEVAYLTDEQVRRFKSDFRFVADYFVQMRKTGTYVGPTEPVTHFREVIQLLTALGNDARFLAAEQALEKKGGNGMNSMSEWFDSVLAQGEEKGVEKGMQQGMQKGMRKGVRKGIRKGIRKGMQQGIRKGMQKGERKGRMDIVNAIKRLKSGETADDLRRKGVDPETIKLALSCC